MNQEIHKAVETCKILGGTIHLMKTIPDGLLYASVMNTMSLECYRQCLGLLIKTGLVSKDAHHVLHWIGDAQP
jgi:hypothetical protein